MAASRDRRASIIDDEAEDVDEVTLDAAHEKGLRKVQVSTWLIFEDSTSSLAAKVVQGVLMLLILISTINMLVESHTACRFEVRRAQPRGPPQVGTRAMPWTRGSGASRGPRGRLVGRLQQPVRVRCGERME